MRSDSDHFDPRQHVPAYYRESLETAAILDTLGEATGLCGDALEDLKIQFFPSTATWSLPLWEKKLGIPTDVGHSEAERRAEIRRKLVARGPVTAATVEELGTAYTGYPARVVVYDDYSFVLELLGDKPGFVTLDLTEFYRVIEEIKPAHLAFRVSALTWGDLERMGLTWGQLEAFGYIWGQMERLTPIKPRGGQEL